MTKKWRWLYIVVLVVLPFFLFLVESPQFVKNAVGEAGCFESFTVTISKHSASQRIGCYYSLTEDETGIFYVFLPSYADLSKLKIEFSGADEVIFHQENSNAGDDFRVSSGAWLGEGKKLQTDVVYETSFVNKGQVIENGKLKLMQSANIPAMFIETKSGTLDYINENKANKEPGEMALYTQTGELEWSDSLVHMTGRGNETWKFDKKSYSIKLKNKADLLKMGGQKIGYCSAMYLTMLTYATR
ncbi:MAG: hypothetical protein NC400_09820 [Clostridium sp.]|nr:hypothetical protein [Clostridium sp.]